jgi:hypothetical protein
VSIMKQAILAIKKETALGLFENFGINESQNLDIMLQY